MKRDGFVIDARDSFLELATESRRADNGAWFLLAWWTPGWTAALNHLIIILSN